MPGGVNSPVRAFRNLELSPIFIKSAKGPYLLDEDSNRYIDLVLSWGPMILGHADPDIVEAIIAQSRLGTSFGAPTFLENRMAELVIKLMPNIEMLRFVNSGTEAVMAAIRLARAYTKRSKIIKFSGSYHGHVDSLLVSAGSGLATLPDSAGLIEASIHETLVLPFNDFDSIKNCFEQYSDQIAAVITEPIIGNSGFIKPLPNFLKFLRELCDQYGTLLIFDEVMTGFRVGLGGAQQLYSIKPDITTLGKVIGGGLPVGAYGASSEIMSLIAPLGPVYQAGTLSGNPIAMAAGFACLTKISQPGFFEELEAKTKYLCTNIQAKLQVPIQTDFAGSMWGYFFADKKITSYEQAKLDVDLEFFKKFFVELLSLGVYAAPSAFEAAFLSSSHSYEDLDFVIQAFCQAALNVEKQKAQTL